MPYMSLPVISAVTLGVASAVVGGAVAYRRRNHRRGQSRGKRKRRGWLS